MSRGLNEEQAAVDASILDVALSLSGQLLTKVGGMLVFNVFHDWVPAAAHQSVTETAGSQAHPGLPSVVIDEITISWSVDNIEP